MFVASCAYSECSYRFENMLFFPLRKAANNLLSMKSQTYLRPLDEVFYVTYETDLWNTQEIGFICDANLLRDQDRRHWFTMSDLGGEVKKKMTSSQKCCLKGEGRVRRLHLWNPLPSEPYLRVSQLPAQALRSHTEA